MKELFKIFLKGIILFKIIFFFIRECFEEKNRYNRCKKIERINSFVMEIIFFILYLFIVLELLIEMIDSMTI